jgi:1-acyl-sn-glycerol-3-phosphate acyltransferase
VGAFILIASPFGMGWALVAGSPSILFGMARTCIRFAGRVCGVRVIVRGKERIARDQSYLFLSNHQGNLDGPILFHATGRDLRGVVKKEMMRIPVLAQVLRFVGFVPLDRQDPLQARLGIDRAARLLQDGISFMAFPEGTRSRDGRLGDFKKGVFVMALKAGVPVLPVSIRNSGVLQPPGRYGIRPGAVEVVFHPPIPTAGMSVEERGHLLELTREAILSGLAPDPTAGRPARQSADG